MAEFKIDNSDLLNFSKFNYMVMNKYGLVGFDNADYEKIVGHGVTAYYFACGESMEKAFESIKAKLPKGNNGKQILGVFEVSSNTITMDPISEMFYQIVYMINPEMESWINCYFVEEQGYPIHEQVPRIHLLVNY